MTDSPTGTRTITAQGSMRLRIRELIVYRELLSNLIRKELKVKYKSSTLGFMWSLLNPAMYLVVFYFVGIVLGSGIPRFVIYLLSGIVVWNLFSVSLATATASVVSAAGLVKKVWFPREMLPFSAIGAGIVHFFLQAIVLVAGLAAFRHPVSWSHLPLVPLALIDLLLLLAGMGLILSAANVYLRDIQHLVELLLLAWFWGSPIVYQFSIVEGKLGDLYWIYLLNPVTPIVMAFQEALYGNFAGALPPHPVAWHLMTLGAVFIGSLVLLVIGMIVFHRLEGNFVEAL
ncbi:MAG: ABC transporter permease [Acidimicrobiales bacterium]